MSNRKTLRRLQIELTFVVALVLSMSVAIICPSAQAQQKPEQLAQQSAETWLALVDAGKSDESWQEAAQLFKGAVTKEDWRKALRGSREPLGKLISRKLKNASYKTSLPGAPDGEYVVIQYDSSFEHKQAAVETVTPMLEKDGQWKVSGYYIK